MNNLRTATNPLDNASNLDVQAEEETAVLAGETKDVLTEEVKAEELKEGIKCPVELTGQDSKDKVKSLYDEKLKNTVEGNGAQYTSTVGMGLAAGLIAFGALERQ